MIQMAIKLSIFTIALMMMIVGTLLWKITERRVQTIKKQPIVVTLKQTKQETILMGSWVEPIPGEKNIFQGFTLHSDGTASSINTGQLLYKTWKTQGDRISLVVESKGKGVESQDIETYAFEQISQNTLLLKIGKSIFTYKRV